jgi:hypothetical protein
MGQRLLILAVCGIAGVAAFLLSSSPPDAHSREVISSAAKPSTAVSPDELARHIDVIRQDHSDSSNASRAVKPATGEALNALAAAGENALPAAEILAKDSNPGVREDGVRLLTMIGTSSSLESLLKTCKEGSTEERVVALRAVAIFPAGKMVPQAKLKRTAIPVLLKNMAHPELDVRVAATQTLADLSEKPVDFEPSAAAEERERWLSAYQVSLGDQAMEYRTVADEKGRSEK